MQKVIFLIILSSLIALVAGIVASWDKLTSGDKTKRILGALALVLILGNSIEREEAFNPVIWNWPIKEAGADQKLKAGKEFVIEKPEYAASAKAEVLLAPPGDKVYFFLDSEKYGGQRARDQLGLE